MDWNEIDAERKTEAAERASRAQKQAEEMCLQAQVFANGLKEFVFQRHYDGVEVLLEPALHNGRTTGKVTVKQTIFLGASNTTDKRLYVLAIGKDLFECDWGGGPKQANSKETAKKVLDWIES